MTRRTFASFVPLLLPLGGTLAFPASKGVSDTSYADWSDKEVQKVLTDSPWARRTTTVFTGGGRGRGGGGSMGGGRGGGMPGGSGMPGGGMSRGGTPMAGGIGRPSDMGDGPIGGMGGGPRGAMPALKVLVRWESALPVKAALLRAQFGEKLPHPGDPGYNLDKPDADYVISVRGLTMPAGQGRGGEDAEGMRRHLIQVTELEFKHKAPIHAQDAKLSGDGEISFLFPRTSPIDLADKDVTFVTSMGPMQVEYKFHLKDMLYQGKLDL